jgi:hypothetical protein
MSNTNNKEKLRFFTVVLLGFDGQGQRVGGPGHTSLSRIMNANRIEYD